MVARHDFPPRSNSAHPPLLITMVKEKREIILRELHSGTCSPIRRRTQRSICERHRHLGERYLQTGRLVRLSMPFDAHDDETTAEHLAESIKTDATPPHRKSAVRIWERVIAWCVRLQRRFVGLRLHLAQCAADDRSELHRRAHQTSKK